MDFLQLNTIQFPNTPIHIAKEPDIRHPVVKASALLTFALEESGTPHNKDLQSAMVTASTHDIPVHCTPQEYIDRAINELETAETNAQQYPNYQTQLQKIREQINHSKTL